MRKRILLLMALIILKAQIAACNVGLVAYTTAEKLKACADRLLEVSSELEF